jgi:uncharacterized protein (TIGR02145 family)
MKNYAKTTTLFKAMQNWKSKIWLLAASLVFINSCTLDEDNMDELDIKSQQISSLVGKIGISDAANDGIDEFYFLAPTVKESPKFNGRFHGNLKPIVEISDDFEFKTFHQVFSREASGKNKVTVNTSDETYSVTWNTADTKAVKGNMYRVRVRINNRVLGFVDVGIVSPQTKALKHNVIPLTENQSMKVAFRIEDKICPARIEVLPSEVTIPVGGEQQFEAIVYNFYDEVLEDQSIDWSVDDESVTSINQSGLASGIAPGVVPVKAQSQDVIGTASLTVIDPNTVTDIEGNVYKTVRIGNQVWMAENLRTTKYNDGLAIPYISLDAMVSSKPAYSYYDNDPELGKEYGFFYYQGVVFTGKICPQGWHVPTRQEWYTMLFYLRGNSPILWNYIAANKMAEGSAWDMIVDSDTNSSGFSALPSGLNAQLSFVFLGLETRWWAQETVFQMRGFNLNNRIEIVESGVTYSNGSCIRCIKN